MSFWKVINPFLEFKINDILYHGTAHYCLVKISCTEKTKYCHGLAFKYSGLKENCFPLSKYELRKMSNHMTWRIWANDGSRAVRETSLPFFGFSFDTLPPSKTKVKLLPLELCWDCMIEGNPHMTKKPKAEKAGLCKCCKKDNVKLFNIHYAYPVDLRHKGYGFTVIMTGRNFEMNKAYYEKNFILE